MLKRPSSRRKSASGEVTLNLVPMLDALVTLISFLLFTMSFLAIVHIETPFPEVDPRQAAKLFQESPLQLTLSIRDKEIQVWSPFSKISSQTIPHLADGMPDVNALHQLLVETKAKFMKENSVVIMPSASTSYDVLVSVMDAAKNVEKTDPPLFMKNETTGVDEPLRWLFPQIVFGNLLGAEE